MAVMAAFDGVAVVSHAPVCAEGCVDVHVILGFSDHGTGAFLTTDAFGYRRRGV